ncbi:response regulator transcription factor [Oleiharenicola sp. Vm1]|uniref:response regulator transcription factor n=1 Tax=Oleiharenicola sp. Vm1 TaxID=3398393 RepID=UPI0039F4CF13
MTFCPGVQVSSSPCFAAQAGKPLRFAARIAIVHPNRLLAELLAQCCERCWQCDVVLCTIDRDAVPALLLQRESDVTIVGAAPGSFSCVDLLPALARAQPAARVIVCVSKLTEYTAYKLAQLAPQAVIEEESGAIEELGRAIAAVRDGQRYRSPAFTRMIDQRVRNQTSFDKVLTPRQEEVLRHIAVSLTDAEVAARLHLTIITAKKHRSDIMRKLGLHSSAQLVRFAQQAGFASL